MSAAQFTPGSWEAIGQNIFVCEHGSLIATCANQDKSDKFNARLIASAPELFEACQTLAEWLAREDDHAIDFYARMDLCALAQKQVLAAIAKATGETS